MKESFRKSLVAPVKERGFGLAPDDRRARRWPSRCGGRRPSCAHGSVVIAAITSCTNTSNPSVMLGAGLVAKKAVATGLSVKPYVKTTLAPGSKVVTEYLAEVGPHARPRGHRLQRGRLRLHHLHRQLRAPAARGVEGGERRQARRLRRPLRKPQLRGPREPRREGQLPRLAAPRGRLRARRHHRHRLRDRADRHGRRRGAGDARGHLADHEGSGRARGRDRGGDSSQASYADVFGGNPDWNAIPVADGALFDFQDASTYIQEPPFFQGLSMEPPPLKGIEGARVLAIFSATPSPPTTSRPRATSPLASPAGRFLVARGVEKKDFNSYGSRRGNDRVMVRGTFANIRLKNLMVPGVEGGVTVHGPSGERMDVYDAAENYKEEGTPLVMIAGKEYGSGSSRDWAAKGTLLLGVRAVIAESYERIHRSNLVGHGHPAHASSRRGRTRSASGSPGDESITIGGLDAATSSPAQNLTVELESADGTKGLVRRHLPPRHRRWRSTTTRTAASSRPCCERCCSHGPTDLPRRGADGDRIPVPAGGGRTAPPGGLRDVPGREGPAAPELGGPGVRPGEGGCDRAHPHPPRPHRPRAPPGQEGLPRSHLLHAAHEGPGRDPPPRRRPPAEGRRRVPEPQGAHQAPARAAALRRDGRSGRRWGSSLPCPWAGRRR